MQRNLRHIWGDMMHYRPLPIRHLGDVSPLSPAGFTPLSVTITTWSRTDGATTCLVWIYLDT